MIHLLGTIPMSPLGGWPTIDAYAKGIAGFVRSRGLSVEDALENRYLSAMALFVRDGAAGRSYSSAAASTRRPPRMNEAARAAVMATKHTA